MKILVCPICGRRVTAWSDKWAGLRQCKACKQDVIPLATPQEEE